MNPSPVHGTRLPAWWTANYVRLADVFDEEYSVGKNDFSYLRYALASTTLDRIADCSPRPDGGWAKRLAVLIEQFGVSRVDAVGPADGFYSRLRTEHLWGMTFPVCRYCCRNLAYDKHTYKWTVDDLSGTMGINAVRISSAF